MDKQFDMQISRVFDTVFGINEADHAAEIDGADQRDTEVMPPPPSSQPSQEPSSERSDVQRMRSLLQSEATKRTDATRGTGQAMLSAAEYVGNCVRLRHAASQESPAMMEALERYVAQAFERRPDTSTNEAAKLADAWMKEKSFKGLTNPKEMAAHLAKSAQARPPQRPERKRYPAPKPKLTVRNRKSPDKELIAGYIEHEGLSYLEAYCRAAETMQLVEAKEDRAREERRQTNEELARQAKAKRIAEQEAQQARRAQPGYGSAAQAAPQSKPKKEKKNKGERDHANAA